MSDDIQLEYNVIIKFMINEVQTLSSVMSQEQVKWMISDYVNCFSALAGKFFRC